MAMAGVLVLSAAALSSCALPTQGSPSAIPANKVPFGLLNPHPSSTTTTQPNASTLVSVKVFFLTANDQLQPAARYVPPPAPLIAILDAMLAGPSNAESKSGITTAIPNDVTVLSTSVTGNVVTVNMNSAFAQITGTDSELAVGQIVATVATEVGLGTGVVFEIEGQRTSVPIANGSQVAGPVYLIEFLSVAP
jgi:spore germination protein GerM